MLVPFRMACEVSLCLFILKIDNAAKALQRIYPVLGHLSWRGVPLAEPFIDVHLSKQYVVHIVITASARTYGHTVVRAPHPV